MAPTCTMNSRRRLSLRSATRPAQAPRISTGANWQATSSPTATPSPVRSSTSRVWAIRVSQFPIWEMPWPRKKSRKFRTRNDANVSRVAEARRSCMGRPSLPPLTAAMNGVHTLNVVQNEVDTSRRDRRHDARRSQFLAAARAVAEQDGLDALTIKGLARRLDCAVGTMYTYFPSKGALLAALQADAIERLAEVYDGAAGRLEQLVADLDPDGRALARLVAFGRFIIVAERRMPEEFHLQQQLLAATGVADVDHVDEVVPVAFALLARPQGLLEDGVARGVLAPGESFDRTVSWVAAVERRPEPGRDPAPRRRPVRHRPAGRPPHP